TKCQSRLLEGNENRRSGPTAVSLGVYQARTSYRVATCDRLPHGPSRRPESRSTHDRESTATGRDARPARDQGSALPDQVMETCHGGFDFYRQATNKIIGISDEAAKYLRRFF